MTKITGLDKITRELDQAQKALSELDGELGTVNFNPEDPASIEGAIQSMEEMIDGRLAPYSSNSIIGPMIDELKAKYRAAIVDKAATARLEGNDD